MRNTFKVRFLKYYTYILLIISSPVFFSCGESIKPGLDKQLSATDKIKVYFFERDKNTIGSPDMVKTIEDKNDIQKIIESISDEKAENFKCGYSGMLEFFSGSEIILSTQFNFEEGCSHYVFRYKKKMYTKVMTAPGREVLKVFYSK